jgi:hypothetical protein
MSFTAWRRWSLRRLARRQLRFGVRHRVKQLSRARRPRWLLPAVFAVGIGILFIPLHVSVGPFRKAETSSAYLDIQWGVIAVVLGLAVAVVGIVMSAFLASPSNTAGLTVREFATSVGYTSILYVGALAILLNGLTLLPAGTGAPGGWPALWATIVSVLAVLGVVWVFERAVDALEPRRLASARIKRLVRDTHAVVDAQLLQIAAETWLTSDAGVIVHRLAASEGTTVVRARRPGCVTDIRVRRLDKVLELLPSGSHLALLGERLLEREVNRDSPLASLPPGFDHLVPRVARAFSTSRNRSPAERELVETLEGLHRQATQAITIGDLAQWREIADGYRTVILEFPRALAESGIAVPLAAVLSNSPLPTGPVDRIAQWVFDELRTAVDVGSTDLALAIAQFPTSVARAAARLDAPLIVSKMLALYPEIYRLARQGG